MHHESQLKFQAEIGSKNEVDNRDNIGYFSILNLKYNCTENLIKKKYDELISEFQTDKSKNLNPNIDPNETENIADDTQKNNAILEEIQTAFAILSVKQKREEYLHMIKIRCYLSQPLELKYIFEKQSGRIYPFMIFDIYKKTGMNYQLRSLVFNFIEEFIEERKEDQLIKGYTFSSLDVALAGFRNDELYMNIREHNECISHPYKASFFKQRDLILELLTFAKLRGEKSQKNHLEKFGNPNLKREDNSEEILTDYILYTTTKRFNSTNIKPQTLKLISNDRIVPPKSIFSCEIYKKGGIMVSDKKLFLIMGATHLILSKDSQCHAIFGIFPMDVDCLSITRAKENATIVIKTTNTKYNLRANDDSCCDKIVNIFNNIIHGKLTMQNIITSLPYSKKDTLVTEMVKDEMRKIDNRIEETKALLAELYLERKKLVNKLFAGDDRFISNSEQKLIRQLGSSSLSNLSKQEKLHSTTHITQTPKSLRTSNSKKSTGLQQPDIRQEDSIYLNNNSMLNSDENKFSSYSSSFQNEKSMNLGYENSLKETSGMKVNSSSIGYFQNTSLEEIDAIIGETKKRHTFGLVQQ